MKRPPLRLVPMTSRKLADVARNIELQAAITSTLLSALVSDRPQIKNKMILELRAALTRPNLSPHYREIYGDALQVVKNLVVAPR